MESFTRLPVWPAWNGVFLWMISKVAGPEVASRLEHAIGGRVCPNFFSPQATSPFIMLVHHCHSFAAWDVLRYIQKSFFPEGFPAHPHRGFITVTYILRGGFRHRDSLGMAQSYGARQNKHTQWLHTGAGMLHEEMFDIQYHHNPFQPSFQELYQLWLNVPSSEKLTPPRIVLLGGPEDTPCVLETNDQGAATTTLVLAGTYQNYTSRAPLASPVHLLHVKLQKHTCWNHTLPGTFQTAIVYVRQGAVHVQGTRIPPHATAYLSSEGNVLQLRALEGDADVLVLAGQPLGEPVAAQGSMVMNHYDEINQAYADYQAGTMGRPWRETLTDQEWKLHVNKYPSKYRQLDE
jgi:redox-sensitive bicupin YhaK (pirin superfamily)